MFVFLLSFKIPQIVGVRLCMASWEWVFPVSVQEICHKSKFTETVFIMGGGGKGTCLIRILQLAKENSYVYSGPGAWENWPAAMFTGISLTSPPTQSGSPASASEGTEQVPRFPAPTTPARKQGSSLR